MHERESAPLLVGRHTFPNGWTASVIPNEAFRWTVEGLFEVWAWHEDGRTDEDVTSWLTASEAWDFVREVEGRP